MKGLLGGFVYPPTLGVVEGSIRSMLPSREPVFWPWPLAPCWSHPGRAGYHGFLCFGWTDPWPQISRWTI